MTETIAGSVFMSYSRKDAESMRRTTAFLRGKGITVWVDNEKLVPGTPIWEAEIERAIRAASAVVVFMSPDSKDSEWVRREITLADQYRKRIFPVLVSGDEDSSITLRLITRQFVDLRLNEKTGLSALHQAVSMYLNELDHHPQPSFSEILPASQAAIRPAVSLEREKTPATGAALPLVVWLAVGWAISGMVAGYLWSEFDDLGGELIAGVVGGGGGGLITGLVLRNEPALSSRVSIFRSMIAWAIGGCIAWLLGWEISNGSVAAGLGMAIAAFIGLAGGLRVDYLRTQWQGTAIIMLAWFIGGAMIWIIANTILIDTLYMDDKGFAWGIGTAIGWAIGGFVMGRQLLKKSTNS